MLRINGKPVEIFWDNGQYIAVVEDKNGHRRNCALLAKTKIDAEISLRRTFNITLTQEETQYLRQLDGWC